MLNNNNLKIENYNYNVNYNNINKPQLVNTSIKIINTNKYTLNKYINPSHTVVLKDNIEISENEYKTIIEKQNKIKTWKKINNL